MKCSLVLRQDAKPQAPLFLGGGTVTRETFSKKEEFVKADYNLHV